MPFGPCIKCGDTNYPSSYGGPNICPSCDCGIAPDTSKLRRELSVYKDKVKALEEENRRLKNEQNNERFESKY